MRKTILIYVFISIVFSCTKDSIADLDCTEYFIGEDPEFCEGNLCQGDTCQVYMNIWKNLILSRNKMSADYFNRHITPCESQIEKWNSGFSFRIKYSIKIEWAEVELEDHFIIWLSPSTSGAYSSLLLPRSTLLNKTQINAAADKMAFSSSINTIYPISRLRFNSRNEALLALKRAGHVDKFCKSELFYEKPHMVLPPSGHPFLRANSILDWDENICISGQIDLSNGEIKITQTPCMIIN